MTDEAKQRYERRAVKALLHAQGWSYQSIENKQPPEPDCHVVFENGERRYFEVTRDTVSDLQKYLAGVGYTGFTGDESLNRIITRKLLGCRYQTHGHPVDLLITCEIFPHWPFIREFIGRLRYHVRGHGKGQFEHIYYHAFNGHVEQL